jgi:hypothetical protein
MWRTYKIFFRWRAILFALPNLHLYKSADFTRARANLPTVKTTYAPTRRY